MDEAGRGVWIRGCPASSQRIPVVDRVPAELENASCQSHYLSAGEVAEETPVRVILGSHGRAKSAINAPQRINYLDVQLAAGERWIYQPPTDHEVAWLAVSQGTLRTPEPVAAGELAVFEESNGALVIQADSPSSSFGSAVSIRMIWCSAATRYA
jgi:redox-sensitive bicupin YhaK (pirin superfamily)